MLKRLRARTLGRFHRVAAAAVVLVAAVGTTLVPATPAYAHHNDPRQVCGGKHEYLWVLSAQIYTDSGRSVGYLALQRYRHHISDTFCAVAIRRWHGTSRHTMVEIKRCARGTRPGDPCNGDASWHRDAGWYRNYAGPVYRGKGGGTIVAKAKIRSGWVKVWFHGPDRCQARWSSGHPGGDSATCATR